MTKQVRCRIIESRPLEAVEQPREDHPVPPRAYDPPACSQPRSIRPFRKPRYPSSKPAAAAAPKGIWIDLLA